ncbi:unnamed protein product, partial [Rotaria socialis]
STSAQFRFDSVDENASESSQCYMGGNSPADILTDDDDDDDDNDEDDDGNTNHHRTNNGNN